MLAFGEVHSFTTVLRPRIEIETPGVDQPANTVPLLDIFAKQGIVNNLSTVGNSSLAGLNNCSQWSKRANAHLAQWAESSGLDQCIHVSGGLALRLTEPMLVEPSNALVAWVGVDPIWGHVERRYGLRVCC